jgi:ATP-dependent helicase HrpB
MITAPVQHMAVRMIQHVAGGAPRLLDARATLPAMPGPVPDLHELPIAAVLDDLRRALETRGVAVLQAPPGAGKTTRIPLALLDESWLGGRKVVMLEPRRLAARAAAAYMARLLGERVGETVGHRMRLDTRIGPRTRIEVVTEGVLGRMLQDDPALDGVGIVIFDEFHERSLNADLGLALTLQTRALLRDDLRILVMSATLDGEPIAALLGNAPTITSAGRAFPVETRHLPRRADQRIEAHVASTIREVVDRDAGDVLVFLPGAAEIQRVASMLEASPLPAGVRVAPLHGTQPLEQQDLAIAASAPGSRKVVLATSIAESSLTIDGVRVVIDSGLMRVPKFSPRSGMTRLETLRVSRASADQRRGRAGRVGPGIAYRLWAIHEEGHLVPFGAPEILETDLAPLALALADAGITDPAALAWLDPPPAAAYASARELLAQLEAIDARGMITPHGRRMATLAMPPRLAHMILAAPPEHTDLACDVAALLGERDVLRGTDGPSDADLRLRLEALRATGRDARDTVHGMRIDRDALRRSRDQARHWRATLDALTRSGRGRASPPREPASASEGQIEQAGLLLALAYPDRIGQRRGDSAAGATTGTASAGTGRSQGGRFLLSNGRGAMLATPQALDNEPYIVVAELDDRRPDGRIFLAAPIAVDDIESHFSGAIRVEDVVAWEPAARAVVTRRRRRLGAIVLTDAPLRDADPAAIAAALLDGIRAEWPGAIPWSDAARRLRERMAFLRRQDSSWPDVSDEALGASPNTWLAPHLSGLRRLDDLQRLDLVEILMNLLDWKQRAALDELAPTHVVVPSGSRIPIDYGDPDAPIVAVRLQEMFGCTDTPRIARGRVPLTVHLLSPAHRPVQVTRDLAGFWRTTYFDVRKDLRGRYPKHHWPDDPLTAPPTNRAKRRT